MTTLKLSNKGLDVLPDLPEDLKNLYCNHNSLTYLPDLPPNLERLTCSYNELTNLPALPNTLIYIYCSHNSLTTLPDIPPNIETVMCTFNELTYLPPLPANLKGLFCNNNQLTEIPRLPLGIQHIAYGDNNLREPFNTFWRQYFHDRDFNRIPALAAFIKSVNDHWDSLENVKRKGRNAMGLQFLAEGRQNIPESVVGHIGTLLTGTPAEGFGNQLPRQQRQLQSKAHILKTGEEGPLPASRYMLEAQRQSENSKRKKARNTRKARKARKARKSRKSL
jgi:Leucine-rich repeat (LRR) protein